MTIFLCVVIVVLFYLAYNLDQQCKKARELLDYRRDRIVMKNDAIQLAIEKISWLAVSSGDKEIIEQVNGIVEELSEAVK